MVRVTERVRVRGRVRGAFRVISDMWLLLKTMQCNKSDLNVAVLWQWQYSSIVFSQTKKTNSAIALRGLVSYKSFIIVVQFVNTHLSVCAINFSMEKQRGPIILIMHHFVILTARCNFCSRWLCVSLAPAAECYTLLRALYGSSWGASNAFKVL